MSDTEYSNVTQVSHPASSHISTFACTRLIRGEDEAQFRALHQALRTNLAPSDLVDELEVGRIADLTWEIFRQRRLQAASYRAIEPAALQKLFFEDGPVKIGSERWHELHAIIDRGAAITADVLAATCVLEHQDHFDKMEERVAVLEARRRSAIQFYEDRRAYCAKDAKPVTALPSASISPKQGE